MHQLYSAVTTYMRGTLLDCHHHHHHTSIRSFRLTAPVVVWLAVATRCPAGWPRGFRPRWPSVMMLGPAEPRPDSDLATDQRLLQRLMVAIKRQKQANLISYRARDDGGGIWNEMRWERYRGKVYRPWDGQEAAAQHCINWLTDFTRRVIFDRRNRSHKMNSSGTRMLSMKMMMMMNAAFWLCSSNYRPYYILSTRN